MTPDQLAQELPDWVRLTVWNRKEKYQIDGCCFGIESVEVDCPSPVQVEPIQTGLDYFPVSLLIGLYISIGLYKIK
ncbi:MAG: hypothetical protein GWN62_16775 [Aliifodinibius sp.]|nr:hypothetical protein [Fodinibius sp.]